jgi:cupin superfamily acireductone dioxygenase involved in methionine salvage
MIFDLKKINNNNNLNIIKNLNYQKEILISNKLQNYIKQKSLERIQNFYKPELNKKILFLIAAHSNTNFKIDNLIKTIKYLKNECITIAVANSNNLPLNNKLNKYLEKKKILHYDIDNDSTYDFGKWVYLLYQIDYSNYDFVIFMNDSIILEKSITHFINLTIKRNLELYGYNDSTQTKYHYQSYLFSIRSDAIHKFINMFNSKKDYIRNQLDVINNYETKMIEYFASYDCFLKIANDFNNNQNIFFTNDYLYNILKTNYLLPFTKVKRVLQP